MMTRMLGLVCELDSCAEVGRLKASTSDAASNPTAPSLLVNRMPYSPHSIHIGPKLWEDAALSNSMRGTTRHPDDVCRIGRLDFRVSAIVFSPWHSCRLP